MGDYLKYIPEAFKHWKLILSVLMSYWGFTALVDTLPDPKVPGSKYFYIFKFLHFFAGNLKRVAKKIGIECNGTTT